MALNIGAAEVKIAASVSGQQQVDQFTAALGRVGQVGEISAKQTAAAFRILPAQMTDIATQLAGGQNPFLILLQQGGQIKDSFGGVGNTFRAFASALTPARLAIGGVAAAAAVLGKAFYDGKQEIADFNRLLALTGNSTGLTISKFLDLSASVEKGSRQTIGGSKEIISSLFGTGAFSETAIKPVAEAIAKLKDVSGQSADELSKKFAGALMNVSGLASGLNRQIGYLTIEQYKYIQSLEAAGKYEEAMIYNANLLSQALDKRKTDLGYIEKGWDATTKAASNFWNVMMGLGRGTEISSLAGQIDALQTRLDKLKGIGFGSGNPKIAEVEQALAAKREELAASTREVEAEKTRVAREKIDTALSVEALQRYALTSKKTSDEVISTIQREQFEVSAARDKGLITEQEYTRKTAENRKREIDAEIALGITRKDVAAQEPARDEVSVAQRQRKVMEIEAQIAALQREKQNLASETDTKVGTSDFLQSRAVRNYAQDLQFQNQMIALQGHEVRMTAFEFQALVKQKQFEQELAQKTRDMAPDEASAYRDVAKALFEQRQELEKVNEAKSRTATAGAQSFFKSYIDDATNAAKQTQKVMESAFQKTEDALVNFVTTGKLSFKDLADSIIKDLIRMAIKQSIMAPLANMMNGMLGGGAEAQLGGLYANGGAFAGGVQAFATGGVVSRPTLFPMARGAGLMGEAGPEAIMPLKRGADGKLGVAGAGGSGTIVNVNVNDQNNSKVSVQQSQGSNGSLNIDVMIEAAVSRSIAKNGGIAQAIQNRYGLNRAGGR